MTSAPQRSETMPAPASRVPGWAADPAIVVFDGRFYLYPTTDGVPDWGSTSFRVYSSPDLDTWTDHGEVLRLGTDVTWASDHAWAPAVVGRDEKYVLFFTAGGGSIGAAAADSPTGPFVDLGAPLVAPGEWPGVAIDPSVFTDVDGRVYLTWGNGVMHTVELDDDLMGFDPAAVVSHQPPEFREAAHIHRRGDLYYLTWSQDDTRSPDYAVRYATGTSPLGPWTDHGVVLSKDEPRGVLGTGHHSIVQVPARDTWLIAYHAFAPGSDGYHRVTRFDELVHRPDGSLAPVEPRDAARVPLA